MSLLDENDFCAPQWPGGQNNNFFLLLCTFFQLGKNLRTLRGGHFWRCSPFVDIQTTEQGCVKGSLFRRSALNTRLSSCHSIQRLIRGSYILTKINKRGALYRKSLIDNCHGRKILWSLLTSSSTSIINKYLA